MRRIQRLKLQPKSVVALERMQVAVDNAADPGSEAVALWKRKTGSVPRRAAFADVRAKLREMSTGLQRCMYCEDSQGTDIDHYRPKASYPGHSFRWENYLLACSHCNSNEKRDAFPIGPGGPMLVDPTSEDPLEDPYDHMQFVWETGKFIGATDRGTETVDVFGLNLREVLEKGRRNTWLKLRLVLQGYRVAADDEERAGIREVIREMPFQAVVQHFLRDALAGRDNVPPEIAEMVRATKTEWEWAL